MLGTVADDEGESRQRHAFGERIQNREGLGISPVEIFNDDAGRLSGGGHEQELPHGIEELAPLLVVIQLRPVALLDGLAEKRQHGADKLLSAAGRKRGFDAVTDRMAVASVQPEVGAQEPNDGQVW